ncbi:Bromodomain-containing protein [Suillus discolor]|uniref:Bromodomain-containing protein n=1 Tax=Suillus discolor TaxID=1912936 RepID=A0A9P7F8E6_9AGAM|nr:Bromodomain-containing protein [Suillus discolor]KAG2109742.1 Bromodomain-containing protein [Suillus discolor]
MPRRRQGRGGLYAVAHRISEKAMKQPGIAGSQLKGPQWMVKLNGILADEMHLTRSQGLGKTIQTISLVTVTFFIKAKRQRGPYLVIAPRPSGDNDELVWRIRKGNPAQCRNLQGDLRMGQFQVLLTTHEYIIENRPIVSTRDMTDSPSHEEHPVKVLADAHAILPFPLPSHPHRPFSVNFILPKIFSLKSFDEWFNTPFANSGTRNKIELNEEEALSIIRQLHKVLRPLLLRRLKKDVESELPNKMEIIEVRISALQSQLYRQMKKHKMIANGKNTKGKSGVAQDLLTFESAEGKDYPDYYQLIAHPIALSTLRKRGNTGYYKSITHHKEDWKLMFNNARIYGQEGSWVYIDAEEMEKVFHNIVERVTAVTGLPSASPVLVNPREYSALRLTPE